MLVQLQGYSGDLLTELIDLLGYFLEIRMKVFHEIEADGYQNRVDN